MTPHSIAVVGDPVLDRPSGSTDRPSGSTENPARPARARRSPGALVLTVAVALSLLAACSSGSEDQPAKGTVDPQAWASAVCLAVNPWSSTINNAVTSAQKVISPKAAPATTKKQLTTLFGTGASASEKARKQVVAAGIPDVADGKKAASQFTGALKGARDAFANAKKRTAALSTKNSTDFYNRVSIIGGQLNTDAKASASKISPKDYSSLTKDFNSAAGCQNS